MEMVAVGCVCAEQKSVLLHEHRPPILEWLVLSSLTLQESWWSVHLYVYIWATRKEYLSYVTGLEYVELAIEIMSSCIAQRIFFFRMILHFPCDGSFVWVTIKILTMLWSHN
jgi:hypothetical protein